MTTVGQRSPQHPGAHVHGSNVFSEAAWQAIARSLKLSGRELQVARAVFDDVKEAAIAERLGISPRTVHTHMERLRRKLGVAGRSQILVCLMRSFLTLTATPGSGLPAICSSQAAGRCPFA